MAYYDDKVASLARLFGTCEVQVWSDRVRVGRSTFPIVNDVIVALPEELRPTGVVKGQAATDFASDIQETFGREWRRFHEVLPEQRREFEQYFDVVDLPSLSDALVCDLGAGMGRWSAFLVEHCRQVVLVDFSDAIFVARENLRDVSSAVFVMADITALPFADDCCDFAMCIGVLHTLRVDPLGAVRRLGRLAPRLLVYLMYALDNEPRHLRLLLEAVTAARRRTSRLNNETLRRILTTIIAFGVYRPLIATGRLAERLRWGHLIPLANANVGKSMEGIRQVVYDRFFTSIEQRVTAAEVEGLTSTFSKVVISQNSPYWHFECRR